MNDIDVKVVVGANYGDEGKGLATRYFVRNAVKKGQNCLNVLYNGGPQRGHTVEYDDGKKIFRHVCHHIGAGAFDGAAMYFDQDYMIHPMLFVDEAEPLVYDKQLKDRCSIRCYISPKCRVITPYDAFINQIVEAKRSDGRHGSCGHGIWETQVRHEFFELGPRYGDFANWNYSEIDSYLQYIAHDYMCKRLEDYGIKEIPNPFKELVESKRLRHRYIADLYRTMRMTTTAHFEDLVGEYDSVVFEGAQGLALDEDNVDMYPHVTASKTGSTIPVKRVKECCSNIEVCYVTRTYFTRHGAGPFPTECQKEDINSDIRDSTNVDNQFQGTIRYGRFNRFELISRTFADAANSKKIKGDIKTSLFVTHVNYCRNDWHKIVNQLKVYYDTIYRSNTKYAEDVVTLKW